MASGMLNAQIGLCAYFFLMAREDFIADLQDVGGLISPYHRYYVVHTAY